MLVIWASGMGRDASHRTRGRPMAGADELVSGGLVRYRAFLFDSERWSSFEHRPGDVIISTPPKAGTTWTQMLCALLVFDTTELPAPLDSLSPWLDMKTRSTDEVFALLDAQRHRRFIKTHTPLDGLPRWDDVTYVVVGRDPRDIAVSWEHHMANADIERIVDVRIEAVGADDLTDRDVPPPPIEDPRLRFLDWMDRPFDPGVVASLEHVLHHLDTGWQRRHEANVAMFHYGDYRTDLVGEMERLAAVLGITTSRGRLEALAAAASLERMRADAERVVPDSGHRIWKDPAAFFRAGGHGEWAERLAPEDAEHYAARVAELVDAELGSWVHLGWRGSGLPRH